MPKREYKEGCQGAAPAIAAAAGSGCEGLIMRREKTTESWGTPFITHAYLCDSHADKLGFTKTVPAE